MRSKTPLQAEKILLAAARLFGNHRFHEARMEDIAALAEVGKGTLYRYFKDKEELYTALLLRAAEGLSERLQRGVEHARGPRARIVAVVEALLDYFDANPHLLDLIQHAEVMQRPGREFPWQKTRDETMALLRRVMTEAEEAGELTFDDAEIAILMLLGGLRAVLRFSKRPRPIDLPERIVAGLLAGYARPILAGKERRAAQASA